MSMRWVAAGCVLGGLLGAAALGTSCNRGSSADSPASSTGGGVAGAGGESASASGSGGTPGTLTPGGGSGTFVTPGLEAETECNDGIDNDGDGLVDAAFDPGCFGPQDATESSGSREAESGFTTWEFGSESLVVYVSEDGDDENDGSSPEQAVRTLTRGAELVRDGQHDFLLLRRGDTWRGESLGRFKSGQDAEHPLVVGSYGPARERPRVEVVEKFIDHGGQGRSFLALMDLHIIASSRIPGDPDFDGAGGPLVSFVGHGKDLLVEGCHFEYGELIVQSFGEGVYENVEVRASVFEKAYHRDTCSDSPEGDPTHRPSGIYSSHVKGLLLEGNLFDHNGWNEEVESACATIYNHNTYLNADDLHVVNNVFTRASSMHIKLRSDTSEDMVGTRIEDNFFVEGEIGISIGGNTLEPRRFVSSVIVNNVMSDIGRSRPTTRTLSWGVEVRGNDELVIADNFFLNSRTEGVNNTYAVQIADTDQASLTLENNFFYRWQTRSLRADVAAQHDDITVRGNTFVDPEMAACLIEHDGSFDAYSYENNRYFSSADESAWFCGAASGSLENWRSVSGENTAERLELPAYLDPERDIESYAGRLDLEPTLEAYLELATAQSRLRWRHELSARFINDYVRAGFEAR